MLNTKKETVVLFEDSQRVRDGGKRISVDQNEYHSGVVDPKLSGK